MTFTLIAILITILLILLNGIFVAVEFAVVTSKKSKMQALAETGDRSARMALDLMKNLPLSISGAQLGITVTSLGLGLVAEPAFAKVIEHFITEPLGMPKALSHAIAFGFGDLQASLLTTKSFRMAYHIDLNEFRGRKRLQLIVKDIKFYN